MGQIFIINDLSQSQPWLHCLLAANAGILAKSGIELAPFNPWTTENVPHHCHLWMPQPKDEPLPQWIDEHWRHMARTLDNGRDLLLLAHTPWLEAHQYFYETLASKLAAHAAKTLTIIGNPLIALEQRHREYATPLHPDSGIFYADCYLSCARLPETAAKFLGSDNIHALVNACSSAVSGPLPAIADQVRAFLGCEKFETPGAFPLEPLFYRSHDARILSRAKSVRFNEWPRLDQGAYASILGELDRNWEEIAATPLALREKMVESLKDMNQGPLPGLSFPFPPPPDFLLAKKTQAMDAFLSPQRAAMFAGALPEDMANVLRSRYAQDNSLLSENQKIFNAALCELTPKDYTHMGEPQPPVEVTVLTMTYNHERYIAKCMDGVLKQQTSFPVRHIVLDHCSTDGTASIIEDYARRHSSIQPVILSRRAHPENVIGLFLRCRTKYAALCDGDDYFTEPSKLHKQIDFLEKNPYYAISFHPVAVTYENSEDISFFPPLEMLPRGMRKSYYLSDLLDGNFIQTNSVVYRWRFQNGLPDWFRGDLCPGDWYWHLLHAETGKIGMIKEVMSVYRRHAQSLFNNSFSNTLEHRRNHGMAELETYKSVYEHFGESYFTPLAKMANGVFTNFMEIALNENDSALFDLACKRYPCFAKYFLSSIQVVRAEKTHRNKVEVI